ncbi:unnamed protein product [Heligmosomoides polygyrus]|uniref:HTH_48 domain-containing protein n=1 Tax=Heligmosomoides polygyrus TaxID=6339 RepID=A0A183FM74_HELPZ|nr:unnamed protein product [Heligmosomoides polygyrus]
MLTCGKKVRICVKLHASKKFAINRIKHRESTKFSIVLLTFLQMDKRVIRGIYLYEFKRGTTAKEADEKINAAFGQGCSTIRTTYRWYQKFRNGDGSLEEHEGPKVLDVSHNTAARHLKEIGKTKKLERWVPHELSEEQRNRRYEISSALNDEKVEGNPAGLGKPKASSPSARQCSPPCSTNDVAEIE